MSENLQKFIGIAVMAVIVVVGVVVTNNDDSDFDTTRNAAFVKLGDIKGEVKDDGAASKGGDCCDETLYRLGEIEDRLFFGVVVRGIVAKPHIMTASRRHFECPTNQHLFQMHPSIHQ